MMRRMKVRVIQLYADHVQEQLKPLALGLKQQGYLDAEIEEALEGLRPMFDQGIEDVLRQVTVCGLNAGANDGGNWAELSLSMLRRAFDRPQANPALLIKEIAAGLDLMERSGVFERDGRLFLPAGGSSPIVEVNHGGA